MAPVRWNLQEKTMALIDSDLGRASALVIDPHTGSRNALVRMLQTLNIPDITATSLLSDARRLLRTRRYDILLCDYHFEGQRGSGQQLIEEMRQANLLPLSTSVVMVTAENSYHRVAEAAESALDSYLLKPHRLADLSERLILIRLRKEALADIFQAIGQRDLERAAQLCVERFHARKAYWLYAARIGAELMLRLRRHTEAQEMFSAVCEHQAVPWARMGVARAQIEQGQHRRAAEQLHQLTTEQPECVDAFDILARAQLEAGQLPLALDTCHKAVELTPQSIPRLQKVGSLAFYLGQHELARQTLSKAQQLSALSDGGGKLFDTQTLVLQGLMAFDAAQPAALQQAHKALMEVFDDDPDDLGRRLRQSHLLLALTGLQARDTRQAIESARLYMADQMLADFDLEAGCNAASLMTRLLNHGVCLPEQRDWATRLAQRFCHSQTSTTLLELASAAQPELRDVFTAQHRDTRQMAEQALSHSLAGQAQQALELLLTRARETLNVRLVELADAIYQRHATALSLPGTLIERLRELQAARCPTDTLPPLFRHGKRMPGELRLRA
jgi:DNA-binding response OmpR family regulator